MDFINTNFVTLKDLDAVDEKIATLNDEKRIVTNNLSSRVNSTSSSPIVSAKVTQLINDLSLPSTPEHVGELINRYGNLEALVLLKSLVEKKAALEKKLVILNKAAKLESRLQQVGSSAPIEELISSLKDCNELIALEDTPESVKTVILDLLGTLAENRKTSLSEKLLDALTEIHWLSAKESVVIESSKLKDLSKLCNELIDLQAAWKSPCYPETWWAIDTLLKPFKVRFNFHFRQDTKANRISKPEWAFTYVEDFLTDNLPTLELIVGEALLKHKRIAAFEVISVVLQPVREKVAEMMKIINSNIEACEAGDSTAEQNGRLLSHLIFESTSFDQRLRNIYKFNPHVVNFNEAPQKKWLGLTGDVLVGDLGESDAVNNWLNLELQLAKKRFDTEIVGARDAFLIDKDFSAGSKQSCSAILPSYSAYGLVKLFENLTTHFKTLSIVKYQLKYVSRILLLFLDEYLEALNSQYRIFCESNNLNIILTILPGATKNEQVLSIQTATTNGLKALETLTGLYCLAKYTVGKMSDWENELIFIQLWDYYKSILTKLDSDSSIFESTINDYKPLVQTIMDRYDLFFKKQTKEVLKGYVNGLQCNISAKPGESEERERSSQLSNFTTMLDAYLSYLKRNLPEIDFYLISSKACDSISLTLLEYVIRNNKFSKQGVKNFKDDIQYLESVLSGVLLLDLSGTLSNKDHSSLNKVHQSIELLEHFDVSAAKVMKSLFTDSEGIRAQFSSRLVSLSDEDIRDLLYRIL